MPQAAMHTTHLLYLHGFRSSPASAKARATAATVAQRHPGVTWFCPALPPSPRQAMDEVLQAIAAWPATFSSGLAMTKCWRSRLQHALRAHL